MMVVKKNFAHNLWHKKGKLKGDDIRKVNSPLVLCHQISLLSYYLLVI